MLGLHILLPFAFFAIVNALPPAGTYNIISRILSPTGQQLAVTFNGEGAAITLQPLATTDLAQIVSIQLLVLLYVRIKTLICILLYQWNLQVVTSVGMSFVPVVDSTQRIAGFKQVA